MVRNTPPFEYMPTGKLINVLESCQEKKVAVLFEVLVPFHGCSEGCCNESVEASSVTYITRGVPEPVLQVCLEEKQLKT